MGIQAPTAFHTNQRISVAGGTFCTCNMCRGWERGTQLYHHYGTVAHVADC